MNVTAYISAYKNKEKTNFAALLQNGVSDDLDVVYSVGSDNTVNVIALKAAQFVANTVDPNGVNFNLKTSNKYIQSMLEKNDTGWAKNAKSNVDLIEALRAKYEEFDSFTVAVDSSEIMEKVKSEAKSY